MNAEQIPDPPALAEVRRSITRFGYGHCSPNALNDDEVAAAGWSVKRGLMIDTIWQDSEAGRSAMRGDENLKLLRGLKKAQGLIETGKL